MGHNINSTLSVSLENATVFSAFSTAMHLSQKMRNVFTVGRQ